MIVARAFEKRLTLGLPYARQHQAQQLAQAAIAQARSHARISLEQMTYQLSDYLGGWKSYFGFCQTPSVLHGLDQWIRRRLRSVIWKQGKRRSSWHLANSPALSLTLPNAYFDSLGLPRLFAG